jgi:hypothetical protein
LEIILDTNLLILWVVGMASTSYISSHKKLSKYTIDEFLILNNILSKYNYILVTPNSLAETSNLIHFIKDPARTNIYKIFKYLINSKEIKEIYVDSISATQWPEFIRLGLTDCVLLSLLKHPSTLLTDDLSLYLAALKHGLRAENFTHYRNFE